MFTGDQYPSGLQFYQKETPTQVFPREYYEISKKTYFEKHQQSAASASDGQY